MINETKQMDKVILYFCHKYDGNWEKIYNAIKTREAVSNEQIDSISRKSLNLNTITIIDDNYPNNFKSIYMPPLCLFYKGNNKLLDKSSSIIGLWSPFNYEQFKENQLSKKYVYAVLIEVLTEQNIIEIKKIIENGYKIIIVGNNLTNNDLALLNFETDSLLYLSEVSPLTKKPDMDVEQTNERMLLGVCKHNLVLENKIDTFNYLWPLFKFEKRNFEVLDLNKYSKQEIERYQIIKFNQKLSS